ncbi:MAG: hypothetical protein V4451_17760 [Pseudomonadota bacterium]
MAKQHVIDTNLIANHSFSNIITAAQIQPTRPGFLGQHSQAFAQPPFLPVRQKITPLGASLGTPYITQEQRKTQRS